MIDVPHKECTKCGVDKPLSDYYNSSRTKDGVLPRCKVCISELHKDYYSKNALLREKIRAQNLQWRKDNPERYKARTKAWVINNPEKCLASRTKLKNRNYMKLRELFGPVCLDCGREYPMPIFEYHHPDASVKQSKLHIAGWVWERVQAYVQDCVQLCPTCHRLRHFMDKINLDVTSQTPKWAEGLPVAAEGSTARAYGEAK